VRSRSKCEATYQESNFFPGSLVGGNIAGYMLGSHCGAMFNISGLVMIVCGGLTFLIPEIMSRK
jgi:hypothetical protein